MSFGFGFGFTKTAIASAIATFSPSSLFANGEQGVWYDPSDLTTLYRDAAGTTPVTAVEQPVGLMLDKSKGLVLGPELVTNGDFSSDTWWLKGAGCAITGGAGVATAAASGSGWYKTGLLAIGNYYEITFTVVSCSAGAFRVGFFATAYSQAYSAPGTYTVRLRADGTGFVVETVGITTGSIDNVSVKQVSGNHAFNPSGNSANFPVLSARYNLLTKTEDFSDGVWSKINATATGGQLAPDGTYTAARIQLNTGTAFGSFVTQGSMPNQPGAFIKFSACVWCASGTQKVTVGIVQSGVASSYSEYKTITTTPTLIEHTAQFTAGGSGTTLNIITGTDGIGADFFIWHPDLRVANDGVNLPSYQRVNTATDYDTVGFKPYLRFNGVNQWLQTNSIDFTYGDKMFVCAGVRKLSDSGSGTIINELSNIASNPGSFYTITSSISGYGFGSNGNSLRVVETWTPAAPITNVLSGIGNISGDQVILRVNGTQVAMTTADQGTGNYGNYPLYIGARAGTSLWFNGRLYQLVIADGGYQAYLLENDDFLLLEDGTSMLTEYGSNPSLPTIQRVEAFVNNKTGAY